VSYSHAPLELVLPRRDLELDAFDGLALEAHRFGLLQKGGPVLDLARDLLDLLGLEGLGLRGRGRGLLRQAPSLPPLALDARLLQGLRSSLGRQRRLAERHLVGQGLAAPKLCDFLQTSFLGVRRRTVDAGRSISGVAHGHVLENLVDRRRVALAGHEINGLVRRSRVLLAPGLDGGRLLSSMRIRARVSCVELRAAGDEFRHLFPWLGRQLGISYVRVARRTAIQLLEHAAGLRRRVEGLPGLVLGHAWLGAPGGSLHGLASQPVFGSKPARHRGAGSQQRGVPRRLAG
ncbi:unnamed protein product, partial [Pelagomonas calceolata]